MTLDTDRSKETYEERYVTLSCR